MNNLDLDLDRDDLDQWLTPPGVASDFLDWCCIGADESLLEPSVGEGSLIPVGHERVLAIDIDPERLRILKRIHPQADTLCANFLELEPPKQPYLDVSTLNPPFSSGGEGTFIRQALRWARRACALVRADALHGKYRHDVCWSQGVALTRLAFLVYRPRFRGPFGQLTPHPPKYDYVALEAVLGPPVRPEVEWVTWR